MKHLFSRFLEADPERLHFAAHSHHPWPDVTFDAHLQAWTAAAHLMDDKWDEIFGVLIPDLQANLAGLLLLPQPETVVFAPNTHELVVRIFSCLEPPVKVLTTRSEFHSFRRQLRRWEEAGLAQVQWVDVPPFETFRQRWSDAAGWEPDLVYVSQVFYDSGYQLTWLNEFAQRLTTTTYLVVDGYHGFMAIPTDLSQLHDRAFYLAGGYKYAMAGEGACFMHVPPSYGPRPIDTGWFAGFEQLQQTRTDSVLYPPGGGRFWGATFDPSGLYRLQSVFRLLSSEGVSVDDIHDHSHRLADLFLGLLAESNCDLGELLPPKHIADRGNFLTFASARAAEHHERLRRRRVITDLRGDRLRIGFGIYQDEADVEELVGRLVAPG